MCDMYDYVMLMFQQQRKFRTHWMLDRPDSCSAFAMLMRQRYVVDLCHSAITKVKILCKNKVTKIAEKVANYYNFLLIVLKVLYQCWPRFIFEGIII